MEGAKEGRINSREAVARRGTERETKGTREEAAKEKKEKVDQLWTKKGGS